NGGGAHVNVIAHHSGGSADWGTAIVALQQIVGILPKWWLGSGGGCCACVAVGRQIMNFPRGARICSFIAVCLPLRVFVEDERGSTVNHPLRRGIYNAAGNSARFPKE